MSAAAKALVRSWLADAEFRKARRFYYDSDHWRELRRRTFELRGRECERCGGREDTLVVHHQHYRTLWHEDPLTDLLVLCVDCHAVIHRYWDARSWSQDDIG